MSSRPKKVGKSIQSCVTPSGPSEGWKKLVELAEKLAEQKQYNQAEEICYAILLNFGPRQHVDDAVSTTMHKVSRLRQKHIYPEHYILK